MEWFPKVEPHRCGGQGHEQDASSFEPLKAVLVVMLVVIIVLDSGYPVFIA
jgi:hypothetical protein